MLRILVADTVDGLISLLSPRTIFEDETCRCSERGVEGVS